MATTPKAPQFDFDIDQSVREWDVSLEEWLSQHGESREIDGLATATAVFNPDGRLLIVQRAEHDSMPGRWELPGGAVDDDDPTILHGAARELFEEAGLVAKKFTHSITRGRDTAAGDVWHNLRRGLNLCRFTFHAEVDSTAVKLDPNEHQAYLWATQIDIQLQQANGVNVPITTPNMVLIMLEAFRLRDEAAKE